jgi:endonuclease V-like protein UPF0215 family
VKAGVRALGIAESYRESTSTLAGVVVRANRVADGFVFGHCTVGDSDATDAIVRMVDRLDREDVRYLLVSGVALAWFNIVDLRTIHAETDLPVISVTYEESAGLASAIEAAFDDQDVVEQRLTTFRAQPPRRPVSVNDETVYVRHVGLDESAANDIVRAFTPEGGRPEPLRVAGLAASAADAFRRA